MELIEIQAYAGTFDFTSILQGLNYAKHYINPSNITIVVPDIRNEYCSCGRGVIYRINFVDGKCLYVNEDYLGNLLLTLGEYKRG